MFVHILDKPSQSVPALVWFWAGLGQVLRPVLGKLVGSTSRTNKGWTIGMRYGQHRGPRFICRINRVHRRCGNGKAWYGWNSGSSVGSLSAQLTGSGSAYLGYGNCWNSGVVKVYLNGKEIDSAPPNTPKKFVAFYFKDGAKLEIKDEGRNSVVHINYLLILKCKGM